MQIAENTEEKFVIDIEQNFDQFEEKLTRNQKKKCVKKSTMTPGKQEEKLMFVNQNINFFLGGGIVENAGK